MLLNDGLKSLAAYIPPEMGCNKWPLYPCLTDVILCGHVVGATPCQVDALADRKSGTLMASSTPYRHDYTVSIW